MQNFFKHAGYALGTYKQTYEKIFLADGFNTDDTELYLSSYNCKSLVKDKMCFKNSENLKYIDLFITNSPGSFQKTTAVASGLSYFHKMAVCKTSCQKSKPKEILCGNYKNFDINRIKTI